MRTNKARLVEQLGDMLISFSGVPDEDYAEHIAAYEERAKPWADRIMDDINMGIIAAERPGA